MLKGETIMKKLMFMLTTMLMGISSAVAEVLGETEEVIETVETVVAAAPAAINTGDLLGKGLVVTAGGLCGVFLVLILFFFTIKLLQKVLK